MKWKMLKEISPIINEIKTWIKREDIIDVILFGSFMRNKKNPNDLDLCIIISQEDEKKSLDLSDSLGSLLDKTNIKSHISILVSDSLVTGNLLTKTLLSEGYSIKKDKMLSEILGFKNKSLFIYTLKKFSPSERVSFHYLLKGRYGSKGILKEVEGEFIGTGTIMIPTSKEDLLKELFDKWKVDYKISRILES